MWRSRTPRPAASALQAARGREGQRRGVLRRGARRGAAHLRERSTSITRSIGRQYGSFTVCDGGFRRDLARARTFGFVKDWDGLRARGLALGANLENTVVLEDAEVLNDELRFPDEFLRHKVGDIVGDLALLGARLDAHVVADRPSHAGNVALARALAEHARRAGRGRLSGRGEDHGVPAAPLPHAPGRPDHRLRGGQAHRRDQERHDQRAVLPGALSRPSGHARAC